MIEAIGYVGSAGAATMWVPQAVQAVRHRRDPAALEALSLLSYGVAMVFNVLLATYGSLEHARPVILAGVVNLLCSTVIVTVLVTARRRTSASHDEPTAAPTSAGERP